MEGRGCILRNSSTVGLRLSGWWYQNFWYIVNVRFNKGHLWTSIIMNLDNWIFFMNTCNWFLVLWGSPVFENFLYKIPSFWEFINRNIYFFAFCLLDIFYAPCLLETYQIKISKKWRCSRQKKYRIYVSNKTFLKYLISKTYFKLEI